VADLRFLESEAYTIFGALFKEQGYKSANTKLGTKYSFGMRKDITTNYRFKRAHRYHKRHNIYKNNVHFFIK
jgi:hypothetical protein